MKNKISLIIAIAVILLGLTACKTTKDKLVGSWRYAKTMTFDGNEISLMGVDNQKKNGTFTSSQTAVATTETEYDGVKVRIKIGISIKGYGDWKVNDDKEIVSSPVSVSVKVTSVKYFDPTDDSFIGELTGSELEEASKEYAREVKADLLEASTERIIMLQDNKYVTESVDDDGKKETITYNRL